MRIRFHQFALIAAIGLSLCGCSEKIEPGTTPKEKGPALSVRVQKTQSDVHPVIYEAVGTVRARLSATVSSKVMGVIQSIPVKEGDAVKQGDLLVVVDDRQMAAQLNQAQAALAEASKAESGAVSAREAAEAGARRAQLAYDRNRRMLEGQAITQETFETVEAQHKQARAALEQAKAMVEAARYRVNQARAAVDAAVLALKDARILAPFGGEVTAKLADAGSLAVPGTPLLTLERAGGFRVDLVVPETYIQAVRTGQSVDVRIPAIGAEPITVIPFDSRVFGTAASNGQMVGEVDAKSKAAELIHELARLLTGKQPGPATNGSKSGTSILAKLLPKIGKK